MDAAPSPARGAGLVGVTVVVENLAPENGTWLTPVWLGLHDGTFDVFDTGSPASAALERLAEDGNAEPVSMQLDASGAGHTQAVVRSDTGIPPLAPGESATHTFVLDPTDPANRFLSYASMVIPSNDAFIGNDGPQAHRLFTSTGDFLGGFVTVVGGDVLDAGTEVNDELPAHTAFFGQSEPDAGDDEGGVVHAHPGYMPPGSGGILDDPMFAEADFTVPGYQAARITVYRSDTVVPGGTVSGTWTREGSPYLVEGDVDVPAGATLSLEPGVIVYTMSGAGFHVDGTLEAIGTEEDPILFTGDANVSGQDGWTGIRFEATKTTSHLEYCTVEKGDRASTYESGGGIACIDASLELRHSTIQDNEANDDGAGIYCVSSELLVEDCEILRNSMDGISSAMGAGIYCESSAPTIRRTMFADNRAEPFDSFGTSNARGGGLALVSCGGVVERCVFAGNRISHGASGNGESEGAGIYVSYGAPVLVSNTVYGNRTFGNHQRGGGIYMEHSTGSLTNTIVVGNDDVGIFIETGSTPDVTYCDVYGNGDGPFDGPAVPASLGEIVQTNANGDPADASFNIFLDPSFVSPFGRDFHLQASSPCIDAGDPASSPDPDGTVIDIGAFFYDQNVVGIPDASGEIDAAMLLGNRPEPLRAATVIRYRLPDAGRVRLGVYDVTGRRVRSLVNGVEAAGERQVTFDGRDDAGRRLESGAYFYRLELGTSVESGRLTILR